MRKSLDAVETCGSSDAGSAIWPMTRILGGVWAMVGETRARAMAASSSGATRFQVRNIESSFCSLALPSEPQERAWIIYHHKFASCQFMMINGTRGCFHDLFHRCPRPENRCLWRRHGDGWTHGGGAGSAYAARPGGGRNA